MKQHSLDDAAMAALIGDVSPSAVKKWRYGERIPRRAQMRRIVAVTSGAVQASDLIEPVSCEAAE